VARTSIHNGKLGDIMCHACLSVSPHVNNSTVEQIFIKFEIEELLCYTLSFVCVKLFYIV